MPKRRVEVFSAGCPVCEPAVELVRELACPDCEVIVYDLRSEAADKAKHYGLKTVPAVVVNEALVSCCDNRGPNEQELKRAGIGQRMA
jgi:glutaredoxin 3